MKLLFKFNDGMVVKHDLGNNFKVFERGGFFKLLLDLKEKDVPIDINHLGIKFEKKFSELYSIEIVF